MINFLKNLSKKLFIFWIIYELFFLFYQHSDDKLYEQYINTFAYTDVKSDTNNLKDIKFITGLEEMKKENFRKAIDYFMRSYIEETFSNQKRFFIGVCNLQIDNDYARTYFDKPLSISSPKNKPEPEKLSLWYDIMTFIKQRRRTSDAFLNFKSCDLEQANFYYLRKEGSPYKDKAEELFNVLTNHRRNIFDYFDNKTLVEYMKNMSREAAIYPYRIPGGRLRHMREFYQESKDENGYSSINVDSLIENNIKKPFTDRN